MSFLNLNNIKITKPKLNKKKKDWKTIFFGKFLRAINNTIFNPKFLIICGIVCIMMATRLYINKIIMERNQKEILKEIYQGELIYEQDPIDKTEEKKFLKEAENHAIIAMKFKEKKDYCSAYQHFSLSNDFLIESGLHNWENGTNNKKAMLFIANNIEMAELFELTGDYLNAINFYNSATFNLKSAVNNKYLDDKCANDFEKIINKGWERTLKKMNNKNSRSKADNKDGV